MAQVVAPCVQVVRRRRECGRWAVGGRGEEGGEWCWGGESGCGGVRGGGGEGGGGGGRFVYISISWIGSDCNVM